MLSCLHILLLNIVLAANHAQAIDVRNEVNDTAQKAQPECAVRVNSILSKNSFVDRLSQKWCGEQVTIQTYPCQPDEPCYCWKESPRSEALTTCLKSKCTLDEQLAAQKFQADTCGLPHHNEQSEIRAIVYPLFGVAMVFTIARLL